ncbi:MAG TPA: efflux RND transporter periplasmic adaptor subunit [Terriglobales bacterium]|nr:efflux RND transporter periplasmic adaptor subunit [Terriglobales bacterium]
MTSREKKLVVTGLMLGGVLAFAAYGVAHLVRPEASSAKTDGESTVPQYETAAEESASSSNRLRNHAIAESGPISNVTLSEQDQANIGLRTIEIRKRNLRHTLAAVAKVDEPETQLASVSARIGGRIEKLYVDFTGQPIRRGQPIALIYSPEVFSTAEEYRLALENRKRLGPGAEPQAISGADDLVASSRRRLELWGLTPQQLDEIASSSKAQVELPIYSQVSGIVTDRKVTLGQYVNTGDVLYTVADLSTVWVKADVYEPDLPSVRIGQGVEISSDSLPSTALHGRVAFLDTAVNPQTRTASARIQVPNPSMRLRPGMFVRVKFAAPAGNDVLAVPRSAVLDTGTRKIVYVAKGNGEFEGRQVQLGAPADDYYPVLAGVKEGERVVSQGNFLVDSQTRITGGMTGLFGGSKEFGREQGQAPAVPGMKFTFRSDPATPRGNSTATFHVALLDPSGKQVSDAEVKVTLLMPAMPEMGMAEMRAAADLRWKGSEYVGTIKIPTAGSWNVEVTASHNGQLRGNYHTHLSAQ